MSRSAQSSGDRLAPLLDIAERALRVTHLAEWQLLDVEPNWSIDEARDWLDDNGFDVAPVREEPRLRYIRRDELGDGQMAVDEVARVIDAAHLVSADLGLAAAVELLQTEPWYFVIAGHELVGVVTRADLQRPVVSMVALSFILSAEEAINEIIERSLGEQTWPTKLSRQRRDNVQAIHEARKADNLEISLLHSLMLEDRLRLLERCPGAPVALGFTSRTELAKWSSRLKKLRNVLAHGGTILDAEPDPLRAIGLFAETREFAEATVRVATPST